MAYRDDRDALKDRISFLEGQLGKQVSPAQLETLRHEVTELKERLLGEQNRLESISQQLAMPTEQPEKPDRRKLRNDPILIAMSLGLVLIITTALSIVVGSIGRTREPPEQRTSEQPSTNRPTSTLEILPVEVVHHVEGDHPRSEVVDPFGDSALTRESMERAFQVVRPALARCGRLGPFEGRFEIEFGPSGVAQRVTDIDNSAHSQVGNCLIRALGQARIPPFAGPPQTGVLPIVITQLP